MDPPRMGDLVGRNEDRSSLRINDWKQRSLRYPVFLVINFGGPSEPIDCQTQDPVVNLHLIYVSTAAQASGGSVSR